VASVVAMSHSVLVETARRFVQVFYAALARGARVGEAMLDGQRTLKDDTFRGRVFGVGELRLEDWFVPVLFQEKEDPQLFRITPTKQTKEDLQAALKTRLGELPPEPPTGFIGRSRELLALERLLRKDRYAVVRGQGGEGKTALAAEFARWLVRSHQVRRAAFVSVETHSNRTAVLDALGRQLVPGFSVATFDDWDKAVQHVERALAEQATLLVVDNMESILLPPYVETPEALSEDARLELESILQLCARLMAKGETRLIFTSREALPAPFDGDRNRRELHQLDREDAVKLVERVLNREAAGTATDADREATEQLVDAVHGHARTLALLAPSIRSRGVAATRIALIELMAEMEKKFPGNREQSVFASVELSLRRMSAANREKARVLGVFHGGVSLAVLNMMMEWEEEELASLANELIETGLATLNRYNHLTLNSALCPYLRGQFTTDENAALTARWTEAMRAYAEFLRQQCNEDAELAATLTALDMPDLFALLEFEHCKGDAEKTLNLATSLSRLLLFSGKPRLLERVAQVHVAATAALGKTWNHTRFQSQLTQFDQQLANGRLRGAFDGATQLLRRARAAGEKAYFDADYDLAMASFFMARVLKSIGESEQALPLLDEAQERFEAVAQNRSSRAAEGMIRVCFSERGDCLRRLGRLDEATAAYEESIRLSEESADDRQTAVGKVQLGTVRLGQHCLEEALKAYEEARERFTRLGEPYSVSSCWHQAGRVYEDMGLSEAAEDAYRKSLAIRVRIGNVFGQAETLNELGSLYSSLKRYEEAVTFYRQSADKFAEISDEARAGVARTNIAIILQSLGRSDEARQEVIHVIECKAQFGHTSEPWKSWAVLAAIETHVGDLTAASKANSKAIACYLAYRRDGGENHDSDGRICLEVTQALLAGLPTNAASFLQELEADPDLPTLLHPFIQALQAIVAGSRDHALADAPDMYYRMAAEILFLLETLERPR
jgi:tetratricopeptide (TPR) repeat protein